MKKILSYGNRKSEPIYWDISNEELFKKAIMELFKILDEVWEVYSDLKDMGEIKVCEECAGKGSIKLNTGVYTCPKCDGYSPNLDELNKKAKQKQLYDLAKSGDVKSAYMLLNQRRKCEYEEWSVDNVRG